jgi:hypothetical protein
MSAKLPAIPVDVSDSTHLFYSHVLKMFGWKGTTSIRRAVKEGKLTRVRVGRNAHDYRITTASAVAYRQALIEEAEAMDFFEISAGRMKAMREVKAREDAPVVPEVPVNGGLAPMPVRAPETVPQSVGLPVGNHQHQQRSGYCKAHKLLGCEVCR